MPSSSRRLVGIAAAAACTIGSASGALAAGAAGIPAASASEAHAAAASAPTLTVDRSCYVNRNPSIGARMTVAGGGFNPGDPVDITGGTVVAHATVASDGTFSVTTPAPILSTTGPGELSTTLTATDDTAAGQRITGRVVVRSANLAVSTSPGSVRDVARDRVVFAFSGFTPGQPIYGFYMRRHIVATERFGRAVGPCGVLRQRELLFPGGHPAADVYGVAFQSRARYARRSFPGVTGTLKILHP